MCNWRGWLLPGLLTLVLLTAVAVLVRGGPIEADLTARSLQMLEADGTPWASATLDGRDATLSGTAPTLAARDAAITAANRVHGVYRVDASGLNVLPLADPYTLTVTIDEASVTTSGSFPAGSVRASLLDGVRESLGSRTLVDETTLARGAPPDFADLAGFALGGISALENGTITLDGSMLSIAGDAASIEAYEAELARLESPPAGLELGEIAINPPVVSPYTWSAEADGEGVTLSGFVPDEDARSRIVEAASALGLVGDSMERGFGAPDGFTDAAVALLGQMAGLDDASASIDDRDLTLTGDAADSAAYDSANAFLGGLPEGFDSITGRIDPPIADPFVTTLARTGEGYTLSGVLPDETARAVILDALAGQEVSDSATVARGAPSGVAVGDLFTAGASVLEDLVEGTATLSDSTFTLTGTAPSFSSAEDAEAAVAGLGTDALTTSSDITPGPASPYVFSARAGEDTISLSGFVPSEEERQQVLETVGLLFPSRSITDDLRIADGAPQSFSAMVEVGLRNLGRLDGGQLELSDDMASLSGRALHLRSLSQIEDRLQAAAPSGFTLSSDIGLLAPPVIVDGAQCQSRFAELLGSNTIRFDSGSAAINPLSNGLLDRLVRTLQSCPETTVEVAGHTDSQGGDEANQALSQERAQAVVDYVVEAGISAGRLAAVGYGASEPIADNETEEGRAQNRRIAFTVQQ